MAVISGKSGYFQLTANTNYAFREWSLDMNVDLIDVTTLGATGGAKVNLDGLKQAKFSCRGPLDAGSMAVTAGTLYNTVLFAANSTVNYTANVRVGTIRVVTAVDRAVEVDISGESSGDFTAAIA